MLVSTAFKDLCKFVRVEVSVLEVQFGVGD